jgi:hypothetical protein
MRPRPSADVVSRSLGEFGVLVHLKTQDIFQLNETGTRIWQLLSAGESVDSIVTALVEEFHVEIATARHETLALLAELFDRGLIER